MEVEVEAAENEDDNQSVFPILNACCFRGNCVKTGEMKRFFFRLFLLFIPPTFRRFFSSKSKWRGFKVLEIALILSFELFKKLFVNSSFYKQPC